jgi:hypothetical protein
VYFVVGVGVGFVVLLAGGFVVTVGTGVVAGHVCLFDNPKSKPNNTLKAVDNMSTPTNAKINHL